MLLAITNLRQPAVTPSLNMRYPDLTPCLHRTHVNPLLKKHRMQDSILRQ
jgi:hypothetical protein